MIVKFLVLCGFLHLAIQVHQVESSGKIVIKFNYYENPTSFKYNGSCCDGVFIADRCSGRCDHNIQVCLDYPQSQNGFLTCPLGSIDLGSVAPDDVNIEFPQFFPTGFPNPVPMTIDSWQGAVQVKIQIWDDDTDRDELVDEFRIDYTRPSPVIGRKADNDDYLDITLTGTRVTAPSRLNISVVVICDDNFYGQNCSTNCVPQSDCAGQFTCNRTTGQKMCMDGWTGNTCQQKTTLGHECDKNNTCQHGSTCVDFGPNENDFYCCCAEGYRGNRCEISLNPCDSFPCKHEGLCVPSEDMTSHICECDEEYKGPNCESIKKCSDSPCKNNASCTDHFLFGFLCQCQPGTTGSTCNDTAIFTSSTTTILQNETTANATLQTTIDMMQNISSISSTSRPAQKMTTTSSLVLVTSCPANQFGENCETFCLIRNDCSGHYKCDIDNGEKRCISGWSGSDCDINIMDPSTDKGCPEAECFNNGQCFNVSCCCPSGYAGPICQSKLSSCNVDICRNGGSCYESSTGNGYVCACPADYTGILCESALRDVITTTLSTTTAFSSIVTDVTFCDSRLCVNQGTCIRTPEGDRCNCPPGFAGMYCEEFTTTTVKPRLCDENYYGENCEQFCLRQDDCELGQYTCDQMTGARVCKSGWVGSLCNFWQPPDLNDNVDCPDSSCRNGGICMNATCCCPRGFTGSLCHIELLECDSQPCQNGARCRDLFGDYSCDCVSGYGGKNCDTLVNPDATPTTEVPPMQCRNVVCLNNGTCLPDESNSFVCLCGGAYMGRHCDVPIEEEDFTPIPGGLVCPVNYYGFDCAMYCKDSDTCGSGHYICDRQTGEPICINGWVGQNCTRRIVDTMLDPECPGSPCRNNGQCFDGGCCCTPGYTGEFCEEEILECAQRPCLNKGSCIELVNSFTCICPDNYNGSLCESLISGNASEANGTTVMTTMSSSTTIGFGACANAPCLNSGTCFPSGVDYFCICQRNFRGINCEIDSRATFRPAITNLADNNATANSTFVTRSVTTTFFPPFLNVSETVNTTESNSTAEFSNSTEEVNGTTIGIDFSNTGDMLNISNTTDYSNTSFSTTNNDTIDYTPVSNFSNVTPSVSVIFITTMETITSDMGNNTSENSTMMTSTTDGNANNGTTITIIAGGENITMSTMNMGNTSDVMTSTNSSTEPMITTNGSAGTNSTTVTAEMTSQIMESTTPITTVEITTQDLLDVPRILYLSGWWKDIELKTVESILREAWLQANSDQGLQQRDFVLDVRETWDALDPLNGNEVAEAQYKIVAERELLRTLAAPPNQIIQEVLQRREENYQMYTGSTPWRYMYHYEIRVFGTNGEAKQQTAIDGMTNAWKEYYPKYKNCNCKFELKPVKAVELPRDNGQTSTRYIYYVFVDDKMIDPAAEPGPTRDVIETSFSDSVYISGEIYQRNHQNVQSFIKDTLEGVNEELRTCGCLNVKIIDTERHVDILGSVVTEIVFSSNIDNALVLSAVGDFRDQFYTGIDVLLRENDPFRSSGNVIYRSQPENLKTLSNSYFIDVIGDVKTEKMKEVRSAIFDSWTKTYPDYETFEVFLLKREKYVGDYGLELTRIQYQVATNTRQLDPAVEPAPSPSVIQERFDQNPSLNVVYQGSSRLHYDSSFSVLLDSKMTIEQEENVQRRLRDTWTIYLTETMPSCRQTCDVKITLAKPETFVNEESTEISKAVYFITVNGQLIDSRDNSGPDATVIQEAIQICDCVASRERFVDVKGAILSPQIPAIEKALSSAWRSRIKDVTASFHHKEMFSGSDGSMVTRIWYILDSPDNQGNDVIDRNAPSDQTVQDSLVAENHAISSGNVAKVYEIYLIGAEDNKMRDGIIRSLQEAWKAANPHIPSSVTDIMVDKWESGYYGDSGGKVTVLTYKAMVTGADSSLANVYTPSNDDVTKFLNKESGVTVCNCVIRKGAELIVRGRISPEDNENVEKAIEESWKQSNQDFKGHIDATIQEARAETDSNGDAVTRLVFTITPETSDGRPTDEELREPTNEVYNENLRNTLPETEVYTEDRGETESSATDWGVPLGIVLGLILLLVIILIIFFYIRHRRRQKREDLVNDPNKVENGKFSREHFSAEPASFENPVYTDQVEYDALEAT